MPNENILVCEVKCPVCNQLLQVSPSECELPQHFAYENESFVKCPGSGNLASCTKTCAKPERNQN